MHALGLFIFQVWIATVATTALAGEPILPGVTSDQGRFYTVQFSSFTNKDKAEKLISKLEARGITAFLSKVHFKKKEFFRVCFGTFATPKVAGENLKKLSRQAGYPNVFIQSVKASSLVDDKTSDPFAMK
jgi:cell division septation protein DedD